METKNKIKFICNAVKWFDKVNGNTYHSVRITDTKTGKVYVDKYSYTYGYGKHYRQTALQVLIDNNLIDKKYQSNNVYGTYEYENNNPILWNVSEGKKRDMISNGTL